MKKSNLCELGRHTSCNNDLFVDRPFECSCFCHEKEKEMKPKEWPSNLEEATLVEQIRFTVERYSDCREKARSIVKILNQLLKEAKGRGLVVDYGYYRGDKLIARELATNNPSMEARINSIKKVVITDL